MAIPFDKSLGIHPQDDHFLEREVWDLSRTPEELRPLMMHYHPLVIYRFQVLKQADVVLATFLQGDRFSQEEKRADFEYYDPITTGDSTLSAVVQSVIAAEVGYHDLALQYFLQALYVDLIDLHGNTVDGLHVASAGGVWSTLVQGFGGLRDHDGELCFDPRLPVDWPSLSFRVQWRGGQLGVRLTQAEIELTVDRGEEIALAVRGEPCIVRPGSPLLVELDGHGPRQLVTLGDRPIIGGRRADGTRITSNVPEPIVPADASVQEA